MHRSRRSRSPDPAARPLLRLGGAIATAALLFSASACGPPPPPEVSSAPAKDRGPRLHFEYVTIDDKPLSQATLAGRLSVIGLVTTYDIASQAQARFLADIARHHKPRINVALLVLEAPENKPLVEAFASTLRVDYPIALADADTIAGRGPFPGLHHVPSIVILDRQGREAWRRLGISDEATLEQALQSIERDDAAARASAP